MRCATSRLCQYSSGTNHVLQRTALKIRNTTRVANRKKDCWKTVSSKLNSELPRDSLLCDGDADATPPLPLALCLDLIFVRFS